MEHIWKIVITYTEADNVVHVLRLRVEIHTYMPVRDRDVEEV